MKPRMLYKISIITEKIWTEMMERLDQPKAMLLENEKKGAVYFLTRDRQMASYQLYVNV